MKSSDNFWTGVVVGALIVILVQTIMAGGVNAVELEQIQYEQEMTNRQLYEGPEICGEICIQGGANGWEWVDNEPNNKRYQMCKCIYNACELPDGDEE